MVVVCVEDAHRVEFNHSAHACNVVVDGRVDQTYERRRCYHYTDLYFQNPPVSDGVSEQKELESCVDSQFDSVDTRRE